jgi:glycosyltransferase involved in cell wall biosynthesis
MKVLVCSTEYPPDGSGIANVLYNVIEELKKRGVKCTICSPAGPDINLGRQWLINNFGILGLLYYWFQVSRYLKDNDYDMVWLHNPYFLMNNPFPHSLITIHSTYYGLSLHQVGNTFFLRRYHRISSIIERYCLRKISKSTVFTGVGESICEELEKIGIARKQLVYIPNGVDITKFHPSENKKELRRKFEIPDDEIVMLNIGRLTPQKQPLLLVDYFSIIEKRIKNISLYISGKGELYEATRNHAENMNIQKIHFLGYIPDRDLTDLYACSDYFISTSKYEGGQPPLTLAEAIASGLPCIVSDIPHLKIIRDANCGITVHFEDVEKSSDLIYNYLTGIHQDHEKNAREYAVNKLDWKIIAKRYHLLFQEILKKPA